MDADSGFIKAFKSVENLGFEITRLPKLVED